MRLLAEPEAELSFARDAHSQQKVLLAAGQNKDGGHRRAGVPPAEPGSGGPGGDPPRRLGDGQAVGRAAGVPAEEHRGLRRGAHRPAARAVHGVGQPHLHGLPVGTSTNKHGRRRLLG